MEEAKQTQVVSIQQVIVSRHNHANLDFTTSMVNASLAFLQSIYIMNNRDLFTCISKHKIVLQRMKKEIETIEVVKVRKHQYLDT